METLARTVDTPQVVLVYANQDISADIAPALLSLSYTDYVEGESDSLEIELADPDHRWQAAWYPQHGDTLSAQLGYAGQALLQCGTFEIDTIELSGAPDVVTIKALAAGVKRSVRTRNGRAYEATTLKDIAANIAQRNRLTLQGTIETIAIKYVAQAFESDLAFLKRIAGEYGYAFSIRGAVLTLFKRSELAAGAPVLQLTRSELINYRFTDKVHSIAADATSIYHDPRAKKVRGHHSKDAAGKTNRHSADTLNLSIRAETDQQAQLKTEAMLARKNEDQTEARFSLYGTPKAVSGMNVALAGFGLLDGNYAIGQATHRISSSGYLTEIETKRIRA